MKFDENWYYLAKLFGKKIYVRHDSIADKILYFIYSLLFIAILVFALMLSTYIETH